MKHLKSHLSLHRYLSNPNREIVAQPEPDRTRITFGAFGGEKFFLVWRGPNTEATGDGGETTRAPAAFIHLKQSLCWSVQTWKTQVNAEKSISPCS